MHWEKPFTLITPDREPASPATMTLFILNFFIISSGLITFIVSMAKYEHESDMPGFNYYCNTLLEFPARLLWTHYIMGLLFVAVVAAILIAILFFKFRRDRPRLIVLAFSFLVSSASFIVLFIPIFMGLYIVHYTG